MITLYAVYERPADYPSSYVIRRWLISPDAVVKAGMAPLAPFPARVDTELESEWGGHYPSFPAKKTAADPILTVAKDGLLMAQTLADARKLLPKGLKRFPNQGGSDPHLIEVWG